MKAKRGGSVALRGLSTTLLRFFLSFYPPSSPRARGERSSFRNSSEAGSSFFLHGVQAFYLSPRGPQRREPQVLVSCVRSTDRVAGVQRFCLSAGPTAHGKRPMWLSYRPCRLYHTTHARVSVSANDTRRVVRLCFAYSFTVREGLGLRRVEDGRSTPRPLPALPKPPPSPQPTLLFCGAM